MHSYNSQANRCMMVNNMVSFGGQRPKDCSVLLICCIIWPILGQRWEWLLEPFLTSRKSDDIFHEINWAIWVNAVWVHVSHSYFHISWNVIPLVKNSQDGKTIPDITAIHFVFTQELPLQILIQLASHVSLEPAAFKIITGHSNNGLQHTWESKRC